MNTRVDKSPENRNGFSLNKSGARSNQSTMQFVDNRPEFVAQRKMQNLANHAASQTANPIQQSENKTGLPDQLKSGIESLSGYSMDDVKVHYNSGKPAQLQAHAYAQGSEIHVAAGQERHLPHEAWHVVQQKQGRVQPTMQLKGKVDINDDTSLEQEADIMGEKLKSSDSNRSSQHLILDHRSGLRSSVPKPVLQGYFTYNGRRLINMQAVVVSLFQSTEGFGATLNDYNTRFRDSDNPTDFMDWFETEFEKRGMHDVDIIKKGALNISVSEVIGNLVGNTYAAPVAQAPMAQERSEAGPSGKSDEAEAPPKLDKSEIKQSLSQSPVIDEFAQDILSKYGYKIGPGEMGTIFSGANRAETLKVLAQAQKHGVSVVTYINQSMKSKSKEHQSKISSVAVDGGYCQAIATEWIRSLVAEDPTMWNRISDWTTQQSGFITVQRQQEQGQHYLIGKLEEERTVARGKQKTRNEFRDKSKTMMSYLVDKASALIYDNFDKDIEAELLRSVENHKDTLIEANIPGARVVGKSTRRGWPIEKVVMNLNHGITYINLSMKKDGHALAALLNGDGTMFLLDPNGALWQGPQANVAKMIQEYWEIHNLTSWYTEGEWILVNIMAKSDRFEF